MSNHRVLGEAVLTLGENEGAGSSEETLTKRFIELDEELAPRVDEYIVESGLSLNELVNNALMGLIEPSEISI